MSFNISLSLVSFVLCLTLVRLFVNTRNRLQGQINKLLRQQADRDCAFIEFIQECEGTFAEMSRLLLKEGVSENFLNPDVLIPLAAKSLLKAEDVIGCAPPPLPVLEDRSDMKKKGMEKKFQVLELIKQGISTSEVSHRLTIPRGEIELILNLANK
jgi:hypothetical protein